MDITRTIENGTLEMYYNRNSDIYLHDRRKKKREKTPTEARPCEAPPKLKDTGLGQILDIYV